jgi:hypothetical protein
MRCENSARAISCSLSDLPAGRSALIRQNFMMQDFGKLLFIVGLAIALVGILIIFAGKIPWIGRLPGDILVRRDNFTFYFPITTSVLVSILLTFILWLLSKR